MDFILYEVDGAVGTITINRPKALNALNSQVLDELNATLDAVDLKRTSNLKCNFKLLVFYCYTLVYKWQI